MKYPYIRNILNSLATQRPLRRSPRIWRRRRLGAAGLLVFIVVLVLGYRYFTAGQRLRQLAINAMERVTGGSVTVEEAEFSVLEQVRLKGVRVYPAQATNADQYVFAAKDVILAHEPVSLLQQRLVIRKITAFGATLNIIYDRQTGQANLHALFGPKDEMREQERPWIVLRDGEVLYREVDNGQETRVARQQVSGTIQPDQAQDGVYRFKLHSSDEGLLQQSSLTGRLDMKTGEINAEGRFLLEMMNFANLPDRVAAWWRRFGIDKPQGQVVTRNHYNPETGHELIVTLENGAFTAPLGRSELVLEEVSAKLHFLPESIVIEECRGQINEGARFQLTGRYDGYRQDDPFVLKLQTEGLQVSPHQWGVEEISADAVDSRRIVVAELLALLPKQTREAIKAFEPTGPIDLAVTLKRPAAEEPMNYHIVCEGRGATGRYRHFPYPLENVEGKIVFEPDHVIIGPLKARRGLEQIDLEGDWRREAAGSFYEVNVQTKHLPLNEELYLCLEPWQQRLWTKFQPTGETQATYRVVQTPGAPLEQYLTANITNGTLQYQDFPLPLSDVAAVLTYDPQKLTFDLTQATAAGGTLTMNGGINHRQSQAKADLTMHFKGLHLGPDFADLLKAGPAAFWRRLGLSVTTDGKGVFHLPLDDFQAESNQVAQVEEPLRYDIQFAIANGRFQYENIPYELTGLRGAGRLTDLRLTFTELQAEHGASQFALSGWVQADEGYELSLLGDPLVADEAFHEAVAPLRFGLWRQVRLWGPMRTDVRLRVTPDEPLAYQAVIEPQGCRVELMAHDYELPQVSGRIVAEPNMLRLEPLVSSPNGKRLEIRGMMRGTEQEHEIDFGLKGQRWPLEGKLLGLLPGAAGRMFALADPNGVIEDMNLHLTRRRQPGENPLDQWEARGSLKVADTDVHQPVFMTGVNGRITGDLHYDGIKQSLKLDGQVDVSRLLVRQREVTNLKGNLSYDPTEASVVFKEISARLYEGSVSGQMRSGAAGGSQGHEMQLEFSNINLNAFTNAGKPPEQRRDVPGRFDGWFNMAEGGPKGSAGAERIREGRFVFIVREAELAKLPLLGQILQVLNLSLPEEGTFHQAQIAGDVLGQTVRFDQIQLRSNAVELTGAGSMKLPQQNLELIFVVNPPKYLLEVPLITSFLNAVGPKLMQVRVTGPLSEPKVESVALPDIDDTLQNITEPVPPPRTPPPPPAR